MDNSDAILNGIIGDFHFHVAEAEGRDLLSITSVKLYAEAVEEYLCGNCDKAYSLLVEFENTQLKDFGSCMTLKLLDVPDKSITLFKSSLPYRKGQCLSKMPGCEAKAQEEFEQYYSFQVKVPYGRRLSGNRTVFSFRTANSYCFEDLLNNTITVASPLRMNDPYDTLLFSWLEAKMVKNGKTTTGQIFYESAKKYRIRSFCRATKRVKPYENTLMWSHYANSHSGICIEYSLSASMQSMRDANGYRLLQDVIYTNSKEKVDVGNQFSFDGQQALLYKSREWKYENEVRLLSYNTDSKGDFYAIPMDEESSIRAIYFGINCPKSTEDAVISIFGEDTKVKFFRMRKDFGNIYKLKKVAIER